LESSTLRIRNAVSAGSEADYRPSIVSRAKVAPSPVFLRPFQAPQTSTAHKVVTFEGWQSGDKVVVPPLSGGKSP
jgi:alkyl hydroperoxide reductase subunit AhpC